MASQDEKQASDVYKSDHIVQSTGTLVVVACM